MKKLLIPYIIFLYLLQVSFLTYIGLAIAFEETSFNTELLLFIPLAFGIVAVIFGILNVVFGIIQFYKPNSNVYKVTMISKLVLIPYYVINFIISVLLLIGMLNPFLILYAFIAIPLIVVITYATMFATSTYNLGYMAYLVKRGEKEWQELIMHFIFHFIFVLDVISSMMLVFKLKFSQNP